MTFWGTAEEIYTEEGTNVWCSEGVLGSSTATMETSWQHLEFTRFLEVDDRTNTPNL